MKILLIASDKGELKGFDDSFKKVSGVGPIMAAAATAIAICDHKPDIVFSIGSAGSVKNTLSVGDAYSFSSIITPDQNLTSVNIALGSTFDSNRTTLGRIQTSDTSSSYSLGTSGTFNKVLQPWHETLGVSAVDMEAYGVALACRKCSIPFYAVKLITDIVGDDSTIGKIQFKLRQGREKMIELVNKLISL